MPVTLVTGQPGHGKTAYALTLAKQQADKGRAVYAHGIKDLDYDRIGFKRLDDPLKWYELPDGALIVIDECYGVFPNRNAAANVPEHVKQMATHRHRGFDFILIAQQGLQVDPFLRGLYENHYHMRNAWGGRVTKVKRWDQYQANIKAQSADTIRWIRTNEIFSYYTSTTLNTRGRRLPMWLVYATIGVIFVVALTWYARHRALSKYAPDHTSTASAAPGSAPVPGVLPGAADVPKYRDPADYAKQHLARFPSMPWTAPVYDQRQITSDPQILCMSSEPGIDAQGDHANRSCTCLSEQGTLLDLPSDVCQHVARRGPSYNPYRQTSATRPQTAQGDDSAFPFDQQHVPTLGPGADSVPFGGHATYGDIGVTPANGPAPKPSSGV